jgi:ABC-type Fe3+ transport system permease subunit
VAIEAASLGIPRVPDIVHSPWSMFWWRTRHNPKAVIGGTIVLFLIAVAILAPLLAPKDPTDGELADSLAPPGQGYVLGADKNGRDILSRLLYGTRTALGGALMIVAISEVIGVPIGIWAAYRGGWVDETVTRIWDMLLAFPPLLLAFAVVAAFGPGLPKAALALGILYVPFIARVVKPREHLATARVASSSATFSPIASRQSSLCRQSTLPMPCSTLPHCRFWGSVCSHQPRTGEQCFLKVSLYS